MSSATSAANAANDAHDPFQLGMMYSTGAPGSPDMVAAHKWFNIAAMYGNAEAARLRREIAEEMSARRNRRRPARRTRLDDEALGQ